MAKKLHAFDEDGAKRIADTVRHVERDPAYKRDKIRGRNPDERTGFEARVAKLDAELTFEGNAQATIWHWDADTSAHVVSDPARTITVYDWCLSSGDTVASGDKIIVLKVGSRWMVTAAQCSA